MQRKKILSVLLTICMLFQISMVASATENSPTTPIEEAQEYLLSIGTPQEILDTYSDNNILFLYERFKDTHTEFSEYKEKTFGISDESIDSEQLEKGTRNPGVLTATLSCYNSYKGIELTEVTVTAGYRWDKLPFFRGEDALALNWDSSLLYNTGVFYACGAGEQQGAGYVIFNEVFKPALINIGSVGWYSNLYNRNNNLPITLLSGEATLVLKPKSTMYRGDEVVGNITYGYGHKKPSFFERVFSSRPFYISAPWKY